MQIDYRIVGEPYRGTRRKIVIKNGFATKEEAIRYMEHGQKQGWISPTAFVRSQRVKQLQLVDCTKEIRIAASGTEP